MSTILVLLNFYPKKSNKTSRKVIYFLIDMVIKKSGRVVIYGAGWILAQNICFFKEYIRMTYIHVGFHKTGTTFLQKNIFPYLGLDYRDCTALDILKTPVKGDILSRESLSGGLILGQHDGVENANRLKRAYPEAKIIMCLREQNSFILSHYAFLVGRGDIWRSFESFLERYFEAFHVKKLQYDILIRHYQELFGRENVLVLLHEDLSQNAESFFKELGAFLDVRIEKSLYESDAINLSQKSMFYLRGMRALNFVCLGGFYMLRRVSGKDGFVVRRRIARFYERPMRKLEGPQLSLSAEWHQKIRDAFAESNARTSELIDKDVVSKWNL